MCLDEVIKKISAYDLLNTLIPGGLLVLALDWMGYIDIDGIHAVFLIVLSYVVGLIASRIGSLVLEPLAKKCKLLRRTDYSDFINAEKNDDRIISFVAISNMYRTLAGAFVVFGMLALGTLLPEDFRTILLITYGFIGFILFFCGWVKQDRYISKRVEIGKDDNNVDN